MKRTLLLCSAAALAVSLSPAFAEMPSTPTEQDQTRALNQSAQGGSYAAPETLNGESTASDENNPRLAQGDVARPVRTDLNPADFVKLETVNPDRLKGAPVEDASGSPIGTVDDVRLSRNGTPSELIVELNDGHEVRVSEAALRFNPNDGYLLTNLDPSQLQQASEQSPEQDRTATPTLDNPYSPPAPPPDSDYRSSGD